MKKLLCSAAVCGLAFASVPAHAADGLKMDIGGFFKGYGMYTSQDDDSAVAGDHRKVDIIRNTELHFGGETTLDNGLTVGMHFEMEADGDYADGYMQESYAYFSGGWGRVNFGAEDGAAYLLQVEAPSADSNFDGLRQDVNPINYAATGGTGLTALNVNGDLGGLDYDDDVSGYADKITYLSPIMNGFQVGASYTPDAADDSFEDAGNENNVDNAGGAVWELAARYEGQFNNVGVIVGGGYTREDLEEESNPTTAGEPTDDRTAWNAGIDLDIGPFGVGAAYLNDNHGKPDIDNGAGVAKLHSEKTWVVGVDYTTGPFKLGASYLDSDNVGAIFGNTTSVADRDGVDAKRWTGGVVYTYGPGMTFNGSISHASFNNVDGLTPATNDDVDATSVLLGTQINF